MKKYFGTRGIVKKAAAMLIVFLFMFTHQSFAEETHYDILKRLFKVSNDLITENDIEVPGFPNGRICIEFESDRPMSETYVMVNRYTRIIEARGPLLPKVTLNKIFYRPYNSDAFTGITFDQIKTEFFRKEVKSSWVTSINPKQKAWDIVIRKNARSLIFKRDANLGNALKTYYGYCFYQITN